MDHTTLSEEEKEELMQASLESTGMTREEYLEGMRKRIWDDDSVPIQIIKPGEKRPHVGPVPARQWPWEKTVSDQFGEQQ